MLVNYYCGLSQSANQLNSKHYKAQTWQHTVSTDAIDDEQFINEERPVCGFGNNGAIHVLKNLSVRCRVFTWQACCNILLSKLINTFISSSVELRRANDRAGSLPLREQVTGEKSQHYASETCSSLWALLNQ